MVSRRKLCLPGLGIGLLGSIVLMISNEGFKRSPRSEDQTMFFLNARLSRLQAVDGLIQARLAGNRQTALITVRSCSKSEAHRQKLALGLL